MTALELAVLDTPEAQLPAPLEPYQLRPRARSPYWVYLSRLGSKESERTMHGCLDRIALIMIPLPPGEDHPPDPGERIPWELFRYPHVMLIRSALVAMDWSPAHAGKHLAALRGVLKEAWRLELMTAEDYQRAVDVKAITGRRVKKGRDINDDEMAKLIAVCQEDKSPLGVRDAAITAVLHSTGIRRDEIGAARIECYNPGTRALHVIGKGDKERGVYIHKDAVPYLDPWLAMLAVRRGWMFRPCDQWGHIYDRRLAARTVGHIVNTRRSQAGLPLLSTHDFRWTFIGSFLRAGGDLSQAQKLAGHASPVTTAGYDPRPGEELRDAVDKLHLPRPGELGSVAEQR